MHTSERLQGIGNNQARPHVPECTTLVCTCMWLFVQHWLSILNERGLAALASRYDDHCYAYLRSVSARCRCLLFTLESHSPDARPHLRPSCRDLSFADDEIHVSIRALPATPQDEFCQQVQFAAWCMHTAARGPHAIGWPPSMTRMPPHLATSRFLVFTAFFWIINPRSSVFIYIRACTLLNLQFNGYLA